MSFSVVIALHNKAPYVRRAIESVLSQSVQDFEVIVIDDGSTDGGDEIVRHVDDARIRLITQENAGVSAARNQGIDEALFERIAFLDADDEWLPTFLETIEGLCTRHPEAGVFATAYRLCHGGTSSRPIFRCMDDPEGGLLDDYFRAALGPSPVWSSAVMIPKWVFREVGTFPVDIRRGEDLHMWTRIALRYRVAWSPIEGAVYHLSAAGRVCNTPAAVVDTPVASVFEDFLRSGLEPISPVSTMEEYLTRLRLPKVLDLHLAGQWKDALRLIAKTKRTREFRKRRRHTMWALWIPPALLRPLLRARLKLIDRRLRSRP